jgi:hypothetical protein
MLPLRAFYPGGAYVPAVIAMLAGAARASNALQGLAKWEKYRRDANARYAQQRSGAAQTLRR